MACVRRPKLIRYTTNKHPFPLTSTVVAAAFALYTTDGSVVAILQCSLALRMGTQQVWSYVVLCSLEKRTGRDKGTNEQDLASLKRTTMETNKNHEIKIKLRSSPAHTIYV